MPYKKKVDLLMDKSNDMLDTVGELNNNKNIPFDHKLTELVNFLEKVSRKSNLIKESWKEYKDLLLWDQNPTQDEILCTILNLSFKKRITSAIKFLFKPDKFIKGNIEDQKQAYHIVLASQCSDAIKQLNIKNFLRLYIGDVEGRKKAYHAIFSSQCLDAIKQLNIEEFLKLCAGDIAGTNKAYHAILSSKCSEAIRDLIENNEEAFLNFLIAKEHNKKKKQLSEQIARLKLLATSKADKNNKQKFFKLVIDEISQTNPDFLNILKSKISKKKLKNLLEQYENSLMTPQNELIEKYKRDNTNQNKRKVHNSDETSQSNKKMSASTDGPFSPITSASSFSDLFIGIDQSTFSAGNTLMSAMIPDPISYLPPNYDAPHENPYLETNETISTFGNTTSPFYQMEEPVCFFNYLPSAYDLIEENYMSDINVPSIKNTNGDAILFSEQETDPTCLLSAALIDEQLAYQFPISKSMTGQDLITPASIIPEEAGKTNSVSLFSSGITLFRPGTVNTSFNSKPPHQIIDSVQKNKIF